MVAHSFYAFKILWSLAGTVSCSQFDANYDYYMDPGMIQIETLGEVKVFNTTMTQLPMPYAIAGKVFFPTKNVTISPIINSFSCPDGRYQIFSATMGSLIPQADWTDDNYIQKFWDLATNDQPLTYFTCGYTAFPSQCAYNTYLWNMIMVSSDPNDSCDKDKNDLIAQYGKNHVTNITRGGALFVPSCEQFKKNVRTVHYTFSELIHGDNTGNTDGCGNTIQNWALLSPALLAPASQRRGLDKWIDGIMEDPLKPSLGEPKLTSAYRGPNRNVCANGVPGSRHQFGDAADLKVPGGDVNARQAIVQRWHKIARVKAKADWTEINFWPKDLHGNPCSATKGRPAAKNWVCAHADWRYAKDAINAPATAAVAGTTTGAVPQVTAAMRRAGRSPDWQVRKRVFDSLNLSLPELGTAAAQAEQPGTDPKLRQLLLDLLQAERTDKTPYDEEREDYFAALARTAARLAGPQAATLVLADGVVNNGRYWWDSAAGLGDGGVGQLITLMANKDSDLYVDHLGVACAMLRKKTVRRAANQGPLHQAIKDAAAHEDILGRYLAAECLPLIPRADALRLLRLLRDHDTDASVRDQARASLAGMGA